MAQPSAAASTQPGVQLRGVPLSDLVDLYYRMNPDRSYVVCSEVLSDYRRVSLRAAAPTTRAALERLLALSGYVLAADRDLDIICTVDRSGGGYSPQPSGDLAEVISGLPTFDPAADPALAAATAADASALSAGARDRGTYIDVPDAPKRVTRVYTLRYQPASVVYSAVVALTADLGQFALPGAQTTSAQTGEAAPFVAAGASAGDTIVWRGVEENWSEVLDLLRRLDAPPQTAVLKVVAVAVQDAQTDRDALSLVGSALGISLNVGTAGIASATVAGVDIAVDSLRGRRDLEVIQSWQGDVESGRAVYAQTGGSVPVVSSISESEGGRIRQSIEYRSTGVSIRIQPTVLEEMVRASISLDESSVVSSGESPTFEQRTVSADVRVCYGCVTVISRLASETEDATETKLFGLIPIERRRTSSEGRVVYVVSASDRPWQPIPVIEPELPEEGEEFEEDEIAAADAENA